MSVSTRSFPTHLAVTTRYICCAMVLPIRLLARLREGLALRFTFCDGLCTNTVIHDVCAGLAKIIIEALTRMSLITMLIKKKS